MDALRRGFIVIFVNAVVQVSSNPTNQYLLPNGPTAARIPSGLPKNPLSPDLKSGPLDSNVLNNLAIALQLLIVSNIMNMPVEDKLKFELPRQEKYISKYESIPLEQALRLYYEARPYDTNKVYYDKSIYDKTLPNANFLGSSSYKDPVLASLGTIKPNPRTSMTLMSPYDALGTSYDVYPAYSKKDFQSPYASILAADGSRDLFSVSDLF